MYCSRCARQRRVIEVIKTDPASKQKWIIQSCIECRNIFNSDFLEEKKDTKKDITKVIKKWDPLNGPW